MSRPLESESKPAPPPLPDSMSRADLVDWNFVDVWREGNLLVWREHSDIPHRCIKTNGPADVVLTRNLSWHHPAIYFSLFAGILIYVILAIVLRKQAVIHVGLSRKVAKKRRMGIALAWLLVFGGIGLCALAIKFESGWTGLAGGLVIFGALVYGLLVAAVVRPVKIEDGLVYLKGICKPYLDTLPEK